MGALDMYGLQKRYAELLKLASAEGVSEEQAKLYAMNANIVRHQLKRAIQDFRKSPKKL
jgi:hypothetical protein